MNSCKNINRRESLKKLLKWGASAIVAGVFPGRLTATGKAGVPMKDPRFLVEGTGIEAGYSVSDLVRSVFEAVGGMKRFVSKGDIVAVKPNLSWARPPQFAATTNPEVLKAVIELCQEAGAKQVRIADNTINDPRRCFALTGAAMVAKQTGAELVFPRSSLMREMKIAGKRLGLWPVFTPLVEADKLINIPIAKHHSLSVLTLGMKNWIGGVGGGRWSLHQDIDQSIVDLTGFFKPTVTLIDAIRIMTRNGPSGGSERDLENKNVLILSDDPVAADAQASRMFGKNPEQLGFVKIGQEQGLGTYDLRKLERKKVDL